MAAYGNAKENVALILLVDDIGGEGRGLCERALASWKCDASLLPRDCDIVFTQIEPSPQAPVKLGSGGDMGLEDVTLTRTASAPLGTPGDIDPENVTLDRAKRWRFWMEASLRHLGGRDPRKMEGATLPCRVEVRITATDTIDALRPAASWVISQFEDMALDYARNDRVIARSLLGVTPVWVEDNAPGDGGRKTGVDQVFDSVAFGQIAARFPAEPFRPMVVFTGAEELFEEFGGLLHREPWSRHRNAYSAAGDPAVQHAIMLQAILGRPYLRNTALNCAWPGNPSPLAFQLAMVRGFSASDEAPLPAWQDVSADYYQQHPARSERDASDERYLFAADPLITASLGIASAGMFLPTRDQLRGTPIRAVRGG